MARAKSGRIAAPTNLASLIRGLYGRVARRLKVDPSYVSRVARGERRSDAVEASLERELRRIMSLVRMNHHDLNGRALRHAPVRTRKKVKA